NNNNAANESNNQNNNNNEENNSSNNNDEDVTLKVAALESAYGKEPWEDIVDQYEEANENVTIDLTIDKKIEDIERPKMQSGDYPDVFLLATGRDQALTETMIKDNELEDISDILDMDVYGEDVKVGDKILDGFTDTLATNPYGDGDMYLAPMFYSPSGMFYNKGLFEEKGWDVPETWDDMWELGDKAESDDIALFTYPTTGYFD